MIEDIKLKPSDNNAEKSEHGMMNAENDSQNLENDDDEELQPLEMTRSISYSFGIKPMSKNKSPYSTQQKDGLQDWLNNYRKWKQSIKKINNDVKSESCSSYESVLTFLTLIDTIDLKKLEHS